MAQAQVTNEMVNEFINNMSIEAKKAYVYKHGVHIMSGVEQVKEMNKIEDGWFKVGEDFGSYAMCYVYNPTTKQYFKTCQYDYEDDRANDNNFRFEPVAWVSDAFAEWFADAYYEFVRRVLVRKMREQVTPKVGDMAVVFKGRTLPIGYNGKVVKVFDYKANFGKVTYAVFEDGKKINIDNLEKVAQ